MTWTTVDSSHCIDDCNMTKQYKSKKDLRLESNLEDNDLQLDSQDLTVILCFQFCNLA